jgi:hypothetical protein
MKGFISYCASQSDFSSLLIRPPEISGSYQQRYIVAKQEELGEEMAN